MGPFLRASVSGEDELARLARNEMVWTAWLEAVGAVGVEAGVGQGFTDIGPFLRTLAAGEPVVVIDRTAFGYDDRPLEWRRTRGPASDFRYRVEIR